MARNSCMSSQLAISGMLLNCYKYIQKNLNIKMHAVQMKTEVKILKPTFRKALSWLLRASTFSLSGLPNERSGNIFFRLLTSEMQNTNMEAPVVDYFNLQGISSYSWLVSWRQASPPNVPAGWGTHCTCDWPCDKQLAAGCQHHHHQSLSQTGRHRNTFLLTKLKNETLRFSGLESNIKKLRQWTWGATEFRTMELSVM